MNPAGAFIQIVFVVVAIGIGVTYLQPTFMDIQALQDDIQNYQEEIDKVVAVNNRLDALVSQHDSILIDDRRALLAYMPNEIDTLSVMKDIVSIGNEAEIDIGAITTGEGGGADYFANANGQMPDTTQFVVDFTASYADTKNFLALLEQNQYQLMVSELLLNPENTEDGDDDMVVGLMLTAFSLPELNDAPSGGAN